MTVDFRVVTVLATIAGLPLSWLIGRRLGLPKSGPTYFVLLPIAAIVAFLVAYAGGYAADFCAKSLSLCTSTTDTTVWYMLLIPAAAVPIYAATMLICLQGEKHEIPRK